MPVARRKCGTREAVTDALRERFIECGGVITLGEWDRRGYSPMAPTITATFGGWDAACEAADPERVKVLVTALRTVSCAAKGG